MVSENVLEKVSTVAVTGSLGASALLGLFMLVQAALNRNHRWRYGLLGLLALSIAVTDGAHGLLAAKDYERLRLFEWSLYGPAVIFLFSQSSKRCLLLAALILFLGLATWNLGNPAYATTVVLTSSFAAAAFAHGRTYLATQGFASCVLAATSTCQAIACLFYIPVIALQNDFYTGLGYLHYSLITAYGVVFGWVNVPRELQGRSPVRIVGTHGALFFAAFCGAELLALPSFLLLESPIPAHFFASAVQISATLVLFFIHRHNLVIYTDNVTMLLDQRTASLREAQSELARQNELQAERLDDQAVELEAKAVVIERQRRLELAAQTAGQAAHDIQNLISPILVQLEKLGENDSSESSTAVRAQIRKQLDELLELNAQLLALSRRGRLDAHPLDLSELATELQERFPHESRLSISIQRGAWVLGSWTQLTRALVNLVVNALEASELESTPVQISLKRIQVAAVRRCHLGFLQPGEYILAEVADSGPGITPQHLEQIFEPFFSSKRGASKSGSGLGLSIVASVIEDHKATLDLTTSKDGTTFHLYFPAITVPSLESQNAVNAQAITGNKTAQQLFQNSTVALIDDDRLLVEDYERILSELGLTVLTAHSGEEALHLLQMQQVDLIIIDFSMGEINGLETFYAAIHTRPGVKAILHSSFVPHNILSDFFALGGSDHLPKPASKELLIKTVREVLTQARSANRAA